MIRVCTCILVALLCVRTSFAMPQPTSGVVRAPRGMSHRMSLPADVGMLRAKAASTLTSPLVVRVIPAEGSAAQQVEFIGVVAGNYDLGELLEQADGKPATLLPPLPVEVYSTLPAGALNEVESAELPDLGIRRGYRLLFGTFCVAWLLLPLVIAIRSRRPRVQPVVPPADTSSATTLDQIRTILASGSTRSLPTDRRGQLELLIVRWLDEHRADSAEGISEVGRPAHQRLLALRKDPASSEVVYAMERWLHAGLDSAEAERTGDDLMRLIDAKASNAPANPALAAANAEKGEIR